MSFYRCCASSHVADDTGYHGRSQALAKNWAGTGSVSVAAELTLSGTAAREENSYRGKFGTESAALPTAPGRKPGSSRGLALPDTSTVQVEFNRCVAVVSRQDAVTHDPASTG